MNEIIFYSTKSENGYLSNFAAYPIELDGQIWPTSEHYFQAQKFPRTEHAVRIRQTPSPMIAARLGRSRRVPIRPDWEQVKDAVMLAALRAKFSQHPDLREMLLATGEARIVERAKKDRYWGDGGDGSGRNRLGELLMQVRDELRRAGTCGVDATEVP
ncbi:MAG: NADAR family protein [Planctomycetaceae bacterium]|nr:NADAR family protein [Planctomycetaceae bacterium]